MIASLLFPEHSRKLAQLEFIAGSGSFLGQVPSTAHACPLGTGLWALGCCIFENPNSGLAEIASLGSGVPKLLRRWQGCPLTLEPATSDLASTDIL